MRVVREAVQECAGAGGDRVDDSLARDDCAERRVSAGESFGGDQNIWADTIMFHREVAAGAAHAGHNFVGDQQHAVTAADSGNRLQISGRRNHRAERGSADRFEDERGGLAVARFDGAFEFGGVLLSAVAAAVCAIEIATIAVGHADVRELADHGQIHFPAALIA